MVGQVRLRWSSHPATMMTMLDTFLTDESLVDVTLTCEGKMLQAHKVILSASSPYFQKLLTTYTRSDPIIFFKDVSYSDLAAMVSFIYRGEVNISNDNLPSFLSLAEQLEIRGLSNQSPDNLPGKQIKTKVLAAVAAGAGKRSSGSSPAAVEPAPLHTNNTPPPLKRARPALATTGSELGGQEQNVSPHNQELHPGDEQDEEEFEDEQLIIQPNQVYIQHEEENKDDEIEEEEAGTGVERGFMHRDWRDVLAEDDDENPIEQFCLADPETWKNEGLELMDDEEEDGDMQELAGAGSSRATGSDNEPSSCPLCNKVFAKRKTWNTHCLYDCPMVEPKYQCPNCEYRARRGYQLKIHCLKIHGLVT